MECYLRITWLKIAHSWASPKKNFSQTLRVSCLLHLYEGWCYSLSFAWRDTETLRLNSQLLVCFPNTCNSQGCSRSHSTGQVFRRTCVDPAWWQCNSPPTKAGIGVELQSAFQAEERSLVSAWRCRSRVSWLLAKCFFGEVILIHMRATIVGIMHGIILT